VDSCFWKESKWEDVNKEDVESHNRSERKICAKKGEGVSVVKRKERGVWVYQQTIEKRVYQTFKVILNSTGVFCRKEEW